MFDYIVQSKLECADFDKSHIQQELPPPYHQSALGLAQYNGLLLPGSHFLPAPNIIITAFVCRCQLSL